MTVGPNMARGALILIPTSLGDAPWTDYLPAGTQSRAADIRHFVVENARTARAHLKRIDFPGVLSNTDIRELPRPRCTLDELNDLLGPAFEGKNIGLMSDAGCPAVGDPGAQLVARAHHLGIRVVPLVGPSSILLGLMGSGLNGQNFVFHGYLPHNTHNRERCLLTLEAESLRLSRTQIFIETPYRNKLMFASLLQVCRPTTHLCIARELATPHEYLRTLPIADWREIPPPELARRPTLFLFQA